VRGVLTGARLQLAFYRRDLDALIPLVNGPLFAVIFLLIVRHGGRPDLSSYAVVAPVFIALWWFVLFHGGLVVQTDRWAETLELHVAAPTHFAAVVFGRILTVTTIGLVSFVEIWLIARYLLRTPIAIWHPGLLAATLLATAFAMAATAMFMAGLFVLARSAVTFANSASFPFYVLGGILVPVTFLPGWIQPVSKLVFLSWSADLLRASLQPAPVADAAFRVAMVVLLGLCGFGFGAALLRSILRRVRASGELGLR
jgi:ABC-2 type transport system permease protein